MNQGHTYFASPERLGPYGVKEQSQYFSSQEMREFSDALPVVYLILNRCRQMVSINKRFVDMVGATGPESLFGQRPGEALECVNAKAAPSGGGTHEFCRICGVVNAVEEAQKGQASVRECVISCEGGKVVELRVWATPLWREGELFTILSAVDISDENRRKSLERTFFHDISNTVVGIYGTAELLSERFHEGASSCEVDTILHASEWLIDEIRSQKNLMEAEAGELCPEKIPLWSLTTLKQCIRLYTLNKSTRFKTIVLSPKAMDREVVTDPVLLRRILINMVKNALEATPEGGCVLATCFSRNNAIHFSVTNSGFMPRNVQMGLFKRTFSTKGDGRGIGTYSMKLFAERYLGGSVDFTTSPVDGTTFTLSLPITPAT